MLSNVFERGHQYFYVRQTAADASKFSKFERTDTLFFTSQFALSEGQ